MIDSTRRMLTNAYEAVQAGGAGVSFGRNIFHRADFAPDVRALRMIVHENAKVDDVVAANSLD